MSSPTKRSKDKLIKDGWMVQIVEVWNAFARKRKDLFDFVDILAVKDGQTLAIQTTSRSNMSSRTKKITEVKKENYEILKAAGWRIEVWGWSKNKSKRWEVKIKIL